MADKMAILRKYCGQDTLCAIEMSKLYEACEQARDDTPQCIEQYVSQDYVPKGKPNDPLSALTERGDVSPADHTLWRNAIQPASQYPKVLPPLPSSEGPPPPVPESSKVPRTFAEIQEVCSEDQPGVNTECWEAFRTNTNACQSQTLYDPTVDVDACIDNMQGVDVEKAQLMKEAMSGETWRNIPLFGQQPSGQPTEAIEDNADGRIDGRGKLSRFGVGGGFSTTDHGFSGQVDLECTSGVTESDGNCDAPPAHSNAGGVVHGDFRLYPFSFANDTGSVVLDIGAGILYNWEALDETDIDRNKITERYPKGVHRFALTFPNLILWPSRMFGIEFAGVGGIMYAPEIHAEGEGKEAAEDFKAPFLGGVAGALLHVADNVAFGFKMLFGYEFTTDRTVTTPPDEDGFTRTIDNNLGAPIFNGLFTLECGF
jgi:hypothetical protein